MPGVVHNPRPWPSLLSSCSLGPSSPRKHLLLEDKRGRGAGGLQKKAIEAELDLREKVPPKQASKSDQGAGQEWLPKAGKSYPKFWEAGRKGEKAIPRRNNTTNPQRHGTCSREFEEFGDQSKGECRQAQRWHLKRLVRPGWLTVILKAPGSHWRC